MNEEDRTGANLGRGVAGVLPAVLGRSPPDPLLLRRRFGHLFSLASHTFAAPQGILVLAEPSSDEGGRADGEREVGSTVPPSLASVFLDVPGVLVPRPFLLAHTPIRETIPSVADRSYSLAGEAGG